MTDASPLNRERLNRINSNLAWLAQVREALPSAWSNLTVLGRFDGDLSSQVSTRFGTCLLENDIVFDIIELIKKQEIRLLDALKADGYVFDDSEKD